MKIIKDRFTIVSIVLLALWIYSAMPAIKAEVLGMRLLSELSATGMGSHERAGLVGSPMYGLSQAVHAVKVAPGGLEGAVVHFIDPSEPDATGVLAGRARYYLYPMKVSVTTGEGFDVTGVKPGDIIMIYLPGSSGGSEMESELGSLIPLEKVFEKDDSSGRGAVYKVTGGA